MELSPLGKLPLAIPDLNMAQFKLQYLFKIASLCIKMQIYPKLSVIKL
jgi:hypothetical protein